MDTPIGAHSVVVSHERIHRRMFAQLAIAMGLAGCAGPGGQLQPPTLAELQSGIATLIAELPAAEATLVNAGKLNADDKAKFDAAIAAAQAELPTLQALTGSSINTAQVVQTIGDALTIAASFIPAAAPFAPLIGIGIAMIEGFIAQKPAMIAGMPVKLPANRTAFHAAAIAPPRR